MNSYYFYVILGTLFISLSLALVSYFKGNLLKISSALTNFRMLFILIAFLIIYFLTFSILAVLKYNAYNLAMLDLGRMSQAIWNTLHGNFLVCTMWFGNFSRLIAHSESIYLLIAPLYALYQDPKLLLLLQSLVVSLGALPVFWIARKVLKSHFSALCFAVAYLLYPSLQYGNLADFHPDMLATTFLLFTFYYIMQHAWLKYSIFLLLSLMTREYVSLIAIMLGLYIIFSERKLKISFLTIIVGILWFIITVKIIPSYLSPDWYWNRIPIYTSLGSTPWEVIKSILSHPISSILKQLNLRVLSHTALLLLPLGFISLFHPKTLVLLLPIYVAVILSDLPMLSYTNHHNGTMIPFIFISAIFGSAFIVRKINSFFKKELTYCVAIFVLSCSFFSSLLYGPSPLSWRFWHKPSYRYAGNLHQFKVTQHDGIADRFVEMIPDEVSVSASNHLGSHLSQRETIYRFPYPADLNKVDYILVDLLEYFTSSGLREKEVFALGRLLGGDEFKLTASEDGLLLFKKDYQRGEEYYNHFSIINKAHPQHVVNLSFGSHLLFIGYDLHSTYLTRGSKQRIIYYWEILDDFDQPFTYSYFGSQESLDKDYIIVDTLSSDSQTLRIIHLPTYILHPPKFWKKGDLIREEFDFFVPEELSPDNYSWRLGLYAVPRLFFINTGKGDLVPGTKEISLETAEIK